MLRCKAIIDRCNDSTSRHKGSDEMFIMAGMSETPSSSVEDYDDGITCFLHRYRVVAPGMIEENIKTTARIGQR
jgi:hypothetical protein